jgi:hypothetical protein
MRDEPAGLHNRQDGIEASVDDDGKLLFPGRSEPGKVFVVLSFEPLLIIGAN